MLFHHSGKFIVLWGCLLWPASLLGRVHCSCSFIFEACPLLDWFIVGVGFIVGPKSFLVLVNCWGVFIVVSSLLLRRVSLLDRGHSLFLIVGAS